MKVDKKVKEFKIFERNLEIRILGIAIYMHL